MSSAIVEIDIDVAQLREQLAFFDLVARLDEDLVQDAVDCRRTPTPRSRACTSSGQYTCDGSGTKPIAAIAPTITASVAYTRTRFTFPNLPAL